MTYATKLAAYRIGQQGHPVVHPVKVEFQELKDAILACKTKTQDPNVQKPRKKPTKKPTDRPGVSRPGLQTIVTVPSLPMSEAQINALRDDERIPVRNNPNDGF
jgi:hypothetical protein